MIYSRCLPVEMDCLPHVTRPKGTLQVFVQVGALDSKTSIGTSHFTNSGNLSWRGDSCLPPNLWSALGRLGDSCLGTRFTLVPPTGSFVPPVPRLYDRCHRGRDSACSPDWTGRSYLASEEWTRGILRLPLWFHEYWFNLVNHSLSLSKGTTIFLLQREESLA